MHTRIFLAVILTASSLPSMSEVIRSVDKDGNVTFSDQPVPGSVEATPVVIDVPRPSQRDVKASERQAQETIRRADDLDQQDKNDGVPDKADRIKAAQMNLDSAKAHLEDVKVVDWQDRQSLAGGGSKLRPEYLQRLEAAEQQVMEAQKQLDAARRAR